MATNDSRPERADHLSARLQELQQGEQQDAVVRADLASDATLDKYYSTCWKMTGSSTSSTAHSFASCVHSASAILFHSSHCTGGYENT